MQNTAHNADRGYLDYVLSDRLSETPTAVVLADCRIDWNIPGVRPLGPDIAVFVGVKRRPPKGWDTFHVAREGAKPLLVVEITSPSTRKNDLGVKVGFYHRANVPLYVIADVVDRGTKRQVKLIGYRHGPKAYKPIAARKDGRIYLEPLRLWLGTRRITGRGSSVWRVMTPTQGQRSATTRLSARHLQPQSITAPRPKPAPRPKKAAPRPKEAAPRPRPALVRKRRPESASSKPS